jgi:hypothetical protein
VVAFWLAGPSACVWLAALSCCLHAWALLGSLVLPGVPAQNANNLEGAIYFSCWLASWIAPGQAACLSVGWTRFVVAFWLARSGGMGLAGWAGVLLGCLGSSGIVNDPLRSFAKR